MKKSFRLGKQFRFLGLIVGLGGCTGEGGKQPDTNRSAMEALIAFARTPSDTTWAAVPLADSVALGLADVVHLRLSSRKLREPGAWTLSVDGVRARAGTASARRGSGCFRSRWRGVGS